LIGNDYDHINLSHDGYNAFLDVAGADSKFSIRMDYPPDFTNYSSIGYYDIISILGDGSGFVGIQKTNPAYALDVNGAINTNDYKFNSNSLFQYAPANTPTFTGTATQANVSATDYYIEFTGNGSISIPANMTCDALVVGAVVQLLVVVVLVKLFSIHHYHL